ncbi:c-type cytochrome biogenesis protein CcsB [Gorillibacterium sp. sgz5001074]|uniref:c-type cytochrome biogenesis protein CcsB n=1 Tax=Gorillibacterium sp. sgz5001074 TaxID=3446695 RepID=UPI003F679F8C
MTELLDSISGASGNFLLAAFWLYCLAFLLYVIAITGKRWSGNEPEAHMKAWGRAAFIATLAGWAGHLLFFFTRWYASGHIPTSNMYEFMTFLAMMIVFASIVVYLIYRTLVIGAFALPLGVLILAYASVFPKEITPLIPALKSYWLNIHVTTAAAGEAFFAVGFAGGLMYLLRTIDYQGRSKEARKRQRWVEATLFVLLVIVGFVGGIFTFNGAGYKAVFENTIITTDASTGEQSSRVEQTLYVLPPIVAPHQSVVKEMTPFLGMEEAPFQAPSWMKGTQAGRKLNTVIWSLLIGGVLYGLIRLVIRRPLGQLLQPLLRSMDPEDLDEIAYRSIAIGYPVFTLGALIFAMIWAHEAWGRFWGWDPKEVWALITWLFYAAYLHLRLSRGWQGEKSAWLAVIGFLVVMFTLIGVNLVIAGLHSYAGV